MTYYIDLMLTIILLFMIINVQSECGKPIYTVVFQGQFTDCPDFDNDIIDFSKLEVRSDDETTSLAGSIEFKEDLCAGVKMVIRLYFDDGIIKEFFNVVEGDICSHINDTDAPWHPLLVAMNVSSCPMKSGIYKVEEFKADLSEIQDYLTHELCRDYYSEMLFIRAEEGIGVDIVEAEVSCHSISVTLKEIITDC